MSASLSEITPTQGASAKLLDNIMFNRLVAYAFDVPKGQKGNKGEQGLFGEVGNAGATGPTGTAGIFGTKVINGNGGIPSITPGVPVREATFILTFPTPQLWDESGLNAKRNLQRNRGLPGPNAGNTSNIGTVFNNIEFVEIIDPSDGITKYTPAYWTEA